MSHNLELTAMLNFVIVQSMISHSQLELERKAVGSLKVNICTNELKFQPKYWARSTLALVIYWIAEDANM